jgi:hypothetical protein
MSAVGARVLSRLNELYANGTVEIIDIADPDSAFFLPPKSFVDNRNPYTLRKLVMDDIIHSTPDSLHIVDIRNGLQVLDLEPSDIFSSLIFDNRGEFRNMNDPLYGIIDVSATKPGLGTIPFKIPKRLQPALTVDNSSIEIDQHELMVASTVVPGGNFTPPHTDHKAAAQPMLHIMGVKLWITWPRNPHNSAWLIRNPPLTGAAFNSELYTMSCLESLNDCQVFIVDRLTEFVIPRWTLHSVLTATHSVHTGGAVYSLDSAQWAINEMEAIMDRLESLPEAEGKGECGEILAALQTWELHWTQTKNGKKIRKPVRSEYKEMDKMCRKLIRRCKNLLGFP